MTKTYTSEHMEFFLTATDVAEWHKNTRLWASKPGNSVLIDLTFEWDEGPRSVALQSIIKSITH